MLKLLIAEFKYNIWFIVLLYGLFSFLNIDIQLESGRNINFVFWILPFLLVNILIARHDREKRNRFSLLLPVNAIRLGIMRVFLVVFPILLYYLMAVTLEAAISPDTLKDHFSNYTMACQLLILAYSAYFIIYDVMGNINTSETVKTVLKIILINVSLLLLIGFIIFTYFIQQIWLTVLIHFSPVFALVSVFTFIRRKTYLE